MASSPIISWQIDGETVETVANFILGGSKISADGDCSHEIKRHILLGRKVMTNLDSILKTRDITLPAKIHLVKAMVFPVVMYGCESWTIKKLSTEELMLLLGAYHFCPLLCSSLHEMFPWHFSNFLEEISSLSHSIVSSISLH